MPPPATQSAESAFIVETGGILDVEFSSHVQEASQRDAIVAAVGISTTGAGGGRSAYRGNRQWRSGREEAGQSAGNHEASSVHFFQDRTQESETGSQEGARRQFQQPAGRPREESPIRCRNLKRRK